MIGGGRLSANFVNVVSFFLKTPLFQNYAQHSSMALLFMCKQNDLTQMSIV